jgi:hypothetical protein
MKKVFVTLAAFVRRYPALLVGLLAGGSLISAAEHSLVPALIQAACAGCIACAADRRN